MNRDDLIKTIEDVLKTELEKEIKIQPDMTMLELGMDSITFMMLIVYLEDRLEIEIELEDILSVDYAKLKIDTLIETILRNINN